MQQSLLHEVYFTETQTVHCSPQVNEVLIKWGILEGTFAFKVTES